MGEIKTVRMDRQAGEPLEVPEALLEAPWHPYVVRDAVVYQQAKARRGTHSTLSRNEVRGSGAKLWRQKGTGRARVGDDKAPHRRHGGVAHGPKPRDHGIKVNRKVRLAALRSAVAEKLRREELVVVERLEPESHRTRPFARFLAGLGAPRALLVVDEPGSNLVLASRNLPGVEVITPGQLNTYNLLRYPKALITRGAFQQVQERLLR